MEPAEAPKKRRRRWPFVVLVVVLALCAFPGFFVARAAWFPPTFDVVSIRASAEYQDATLLERAWALPVAATYRNGLVYQSNGSTCGPTSVANVLRSLGDPAASESSVLEGSGMCRTGICFGGLTLDQLADVARAKSQRKVTVIRDIDLAMFREHLKASNDPGKRYVINFQRGLLFGKGTGHHSPIAGYLAEQDLVLVLDVNETFRPWLVKSDRLFTAMDSVDGSSGKKRGLLLFE